VAVISDLSVTPNPVPSLPSVVTARLKVHHSRTATAVEISYELTGEVRFEPPSGPLPPAEASSSPAPAQMSRSAREIVDEVPSQADREIDVSRLLQLDRDGAPKQATLRVTVKDLPGGLSDSDSKLIHFL
jgi:hypothetical protein